MKPKPIIFTEDDCPACDAEKQRMRDAGIEYIERSADTITDHPARNEIMAALADNGMRLPVIWRDGEAGGIDRLSARIDAEHDSARDGD
jgi:glutaredoxin